MSPWRLTLGRQLLDLLLLRAWSFGGGDGKRFALGKGYAAGSEGTARIRWVAEID